jgi:hypothetical protein
MTGQVAGQTVLAPVVDAAAAGASANAPHRDPCQGARSVHSRPGSGRPAGIQGFQLIAGTDARCLNGPAASIAHPLGMLSTWLKL